MWRVSHVYVAVTWLLQGLHQLQALPETIVRRFPTGDTRSCTATLTITSNVSRWAYEAQLDDQPWTLGPTFEVQTGTTGAVAVSGLVGRKVLQHTISDLPTGIHKVSVRTLDQNGQRDPSPFTTEWKVSRPTLDFVSAMPNRVQPNSESWVEVKSSALKYAFEFKVDDGPWQFGDTNAKGMGLKLVSKDHPTPERLVYTESPRTERQRVRATSDGPHTIHLRAVDECGNRGDIISSSWTTSWVSTKMVVAPPSGAVQHRSLTISLQGDTKAYSYEYKHNGGTWVRGKHFQAAQIAHVEIGGLSEGPQHLLIRALDAYGRRGAETKEYLWIVDNTPPTTRVREGSPRVEGTTVMVAFDVSDATDTVHKYSLDGADWKAFTHRSLELKNMADGEHVVSLLSTDTAGNEELVAVKAAFFIDASPPTTHIAQGPERYTTDTTAQFWLTTSEKGKITYSLDGSEFISSEPLLEFSGLGSGKHELQVVCIDEAGNRERSPFVYTWTVDTEPPNTAIHAGWGTLQQPRFAVSSSPGVGESWDSFIYNFEYKVDHGEWIRGEKHTRLGPGYEVVPMGLAPGVHTLTARGVDLAGNADPEPATQVFAIPEPNRAWATMHDELHPRPTNSAATTSTIENGNDHDRLVFPDLHEPFEEESAGWFFFNAPRRMVGGRSKLLGELRRR